MAINTIDVLSKHYSNIGWSVVGSPPTTEDEYNDRVSAEESIPAWSDVQSKLTEMQSEHDTTEYQRKRKLEYPSIDDVTVALAEKEEGDSTMWDEITAKRQAIKTKYPKG
jgi:hypothetical protein